MNPTSFDPRLFFKRLNGGLSYVPGYLVNESLHAGAPEFLEYTKKTEQHFESRPREMDSFRFTGIQVETTINGFKWHQTEYIQRIKPLPTDAAYRQFRSVHQKLYRIVHTWPDIACTVNKSSQITETQYGPSSIASINKIVRHAHKYPSREILHRKLDVSSRHLRIYADVSFAENPDLTTQFRYILLFFDRKTRFNIIHYCSHKSRRIVSSVLGGKTYAIT